MRRSVAQLHASSECAVRRFSEFNRAVLASAPSLHYEAEDLFVQDDQQRRRVPIQGSHLAAMEIYPRAVNAPPAYQPLNGNCGVVLIWTK